MIPSNQKDILIGKIYKIFVKDFVTYENETIMMPGKYLNLIIGANGSGKSTLVAAIVLGLGGNPKLLSRSSSLKDYVKNGSETSIIRIEIYKNVQEEKTLLERKFDLDGKSSFKIDGNKVSEKQFLSYIKNFNIQIDNLCQFLPQDRVQDFAKMNPQEIFVSTQSSVYDQNIINIFNNLKELRKSQTFSQKHIEQNKKKLEEAKQKFETLQAAVNIIKERRSLIKNIDICRSKQQWIQCQEIKNEILAIKNDLDQQNTFFKRDEDNFNKVKKQIQKVLVTVDKIEAHIKNEEKHISTSLSKLEHEKNQFENVHKQIGVAKINLESKIREEAEREEQLESAGNILTAYVKDLENQNALCGSELEQNNKLSILSNQIKKFKIEKDKLIDKRDKIMCELNVSYEPQINNIKKKLNQIKNVAERRLLAIRNSNDHVYDGIQWIRQNRHLFEGHVYEPMILELNIKNVENAKYLENTVQYRDLIAFICESKNDMALLTRKLCQEMRLKLNFIHSNPANQCNYKSREPINKYRQYGFHTYLIDTIEGPAPILNYICQVYKIHEILVGSEKVDEYSEILPHHIRVFFGGNYRYAIAVSKYTNQKSSVRIEISPRNLFCHNIDPQEETKLNRQLNEILRKSDYLKNNRTSVESEIRNVDEKCSAIMEEKKHFESLIAKLNLIKAQVKVQMRKIEAIKTSALDINKEQEEYKKQVAKIVKNLIQIQKNKLQWMKNYEHHKINVKLYHLVLNKLKDENSGLQTEVSNAKEVLNNTKATLETIKNKLKWTEQKYNEKIGEVKQFTNGKLPNDPSFPYHEEYKKFADTSEELNDQIIEMQSKVECMGAENNRIIEEYDNVKELIENLTKEINEEITAEGDVETRIKTLHESWFPKILNMINIINENFTKFMFAMGYSGEIELIRDDEKDYDKYGIKILVKYRDNEKLQALDRFIQSGGERAVAIAVYTLSLQHISTVPFRCVDEINQGMDVTNETKIFNMISKNISELKMSQYFFVTPKFSAKFNLDKSTNVHIVDNGPAINLNLKGATLGGFF